ncbi:MAG: RND efflux system outer membrane lipoprotein [Nitrospirae bacterium]|nr:MAG: RND efflux system outer membrane lipoprotein [Nitrospirota bacterium]
MIALCDISKTGFISSIIRRVAGGLAISASILAAGCATVGPDYVRPDTSLSTTWHSDLKGRLTAGEMDPRTLASWWITLNDSGLSNLIDRAVAGNLYLKKALARVRESRARRGIAKAGLFPTFDAVGSATWTESSKDTGTNRTNETSDLYTASFDAGWEIDIFGGVRRSVEAAEADVGTSQEELHDVLVSLLAEVAVNYIDLRTFQSRLAIAEGNLESQNETYQLTVWRYQAGLSDELSVQQARYNLENTRSQLPTLRTGKEEALNRIAVLLGEQPGKIHSLLEQQASIPVIPLKLAIGVPADVLRNRPDVRKAERELAAQSARIGVATADLYPKLTLSGSIGIETLKISSQPATQTWSSSFGPGITWAIFKAGAIRQNIEVQSALHEQALINYEATILSALENVENALVAYAEEQGRRDALSVAEEAAQKSADLAKYKYQSGLTDFNNVLEAQRSLLTFQDQLAQSNGIVASNLVRLYKALGGGWISIDPAEKK